MFGAVPDDGDCSEQRVLPVLLDPVGHLVEQVRLEPAVHGEGGENRVLDAVMFLAVELDLAQMPGQEIPVGNAGCVLDAGGAERVGGEFHEDFAGEGVVSHVKVGNLDDELIGVDTSDETGEQPPCRFDAILLRGLRHADTLCEPSNGWILGHVRSARSRPLCWCGQSSSEWRSSERPCRSTVMAPTVAPREAATASDGVLFGSTMM